MSWWVIVPAVLAATVVVLLPGLVIAYAATARGITAWALAPLLSMTVFAVVSLLFGVAHLPFTGTTAAIGAVVIVAVTTGILLALLRRHPRAPNRDRAWANVAALVGVVIALAAFSLRFGTAIVHPDAISQTYDDVFHLNGVRYIIDTHDANPLDFANLDAAFGGAGGFYPNLWHVLASLTSLYSGTGIPVAVNALDIVIGGVIWPLGCVLLVRSILGPRPLALLATGIVSVSFGAFPLLLLTYGVLYPNLLGVAAIPAAVALLVFATKLGGKPTLTPALSWVAFLAVLPGLALAHPNAVVSLLVVGLPLMVVYGWIWFRDARRRQAPRATMRRGVVIAGAITLAGLAVFIAIRPWQATPWQASKTVGGAILAALTNAQQGPAAIAMTVLVGLGVVAVLVTRRHRWLVASMLLVDMFYVAAATVPHGVLRFILSGTWYGDVFRLIALGPIVLVPLAVIGVQWVADLVASRERTGQGRSWRVVGTAIGLVVVLGAGIAAQTGAALASMTTWTAQNFALTPHSWLLSSDERALLDRVPDEVPSGAVVAGDPWTGASLVWALADRRPLVPHITGVRTPAAALILSSLNSATSGSAVCAAMKKEKVTFALDFGADGVFGASHNYRGMHGLSASPVLTLADEQGPAKLYKVTGCD